jgi:hypothetical protein
VMSITSVLCDLLWVGSAAGVVSTSVLRDGPLRRTHTFANEAFLDQLAVANAVAKFTPENDSRLCRARHEFESLPLPTLGRCRLYVNLKLTQRLNS